MSTNETNTIGGVSYRLVRLSPLKGGKLATKVGQLLAVAVGDGATIKALVDLFKGQAASEGEAPSVKALTDEPALLAALAGGVSKLDADALYDLGLECIRSGSLFADVKLGDDLALDRHFAEHPQNLLLVLAWALKVNCAGFFGQRALV